MSLAVNREQQGGIEGFSDSEQIFADIARRYDAMNRLMSWGQDRRWRRRTAEALRVPPEARILDVGIGTGDMALAVRESWPEATVIGVDATRSMMDVGRKKRSLETVELSQANGLHLPFPDYHFDAVVSAFLLRNVTDVEQALAEQRRVVRDGGRVACLEMSWPKSRLFGALFGVYFADVMPLVTGLLSGHPAAYRYLPCSVQRFRTAQELTRTMERVGLDQVNCHRFAFGVVMLHSGTRGS